MEKRKIASSKGRAEGSFSFLFVFFNGLSTFMQLLHSQNKGKERLVCDYFYFVSIFTKTQLCFSLMSLGYCVSETTEYSPRGAWESL